MIYLKVLINDWIGQSAAKPEREGSTTTIRENLGFPLWQERLHNLFVIKINLKINDVIMK
jgi:hypothetical protein